MQGVTSTRSRSVIADRQVLGGPTMGPTASVSWRTIVRSALLASNDLVLMTCAVIFSDLAIGSWLSGEQLRGPVLTDGIGFVAPFILLTVASLALMRAYDPSRNRALVKESLQVIGTVSFIAMALTSVVAFRSSERYDLTQGAFLWTNAALFLLIGRLAARRTTGVLRRFGVGRKRVVVVASRSSRFSVDALERKGSPYEVVSVVNLFGSPTGGERADGVARQDDVARLAQVVAEHSPCEVLVAVPPHQYPYVRDALRSMVSGGTTIRLALTPLLEGGRIEEIDTWEGLPVVQLGTGGLPWRYTAGKRVIDCALASIALVIALPLMAVLALAIKLDSPGPVLFRQTRVGRNGQPFQMYKFRSMRRDAEQRLKDLMTRNEASGAIFKLRHDPRITRVGRVIRKLSLDELPQLFNVLEGTMSMVGPRPPLPHEVTQYQAWQLRRLEAIPGLTGLWQVTRGAAPSFDEMVQSDLRYIESWSFGLDLVILLKTVPVVFTARGAY